MATATKKTVKKQSDKVLEAVSCLKPQTVIEEIGALQSTLQGTLAGLSAQISIKLEQMKNVDEAIVLKQNELQELFGIEAEALSLEEMRANCEQEDADWQKQNAERNAAFAEQQKERAKKWQREEEEHAYAIEQKRKRAEEEFNVETSTRRRNEQIRIQDLEKEWKSRSDALAAQEKEVADLKALVAGFDDRLKAEIGKAEAIATSRLKKESEHEIAMLKRDIESERVLNTTKVSAMDDTIVGLQSQIADLNKQLISARTDAKEVTSAALQSASGQQAMAALQRVVDGGQSSSKSSK